MRNLLVLGFCFLLFGKLWAQQWVDKQYPYDSTLNVVYGTAVNFMGQTDTLRMDIYQPICEAGLYNQPRPLMLIIHGGAFLAGSKDEASITDLCKQFARRGYVTAAINYRLGFVNDDASRTCNYPNYACIFSTDTAEWIRAWYRGVQDAKGALRYLTNRHQQLHIDTANVFVIGESAGALISFGVALLDDPAERPAQTFAIADAPLPHTNTHSCDHNVGKSFTGGGIARPDLGDIEGNIEPASVTYTIKGIGNIYGAMFLNLMAQHPTGKHKPAIYSFHQPCDIVVPIDSGRVFWGVSWCMTNGYGCNAIAHTPMLYGSRAISNWNTQNGYGFTLQNDFTTKDFPYNFLFGPGSCADQMNAPCHAYDNKTLREGNMALFFSQQISTQNICDSTQSSLQRGAEEKRFSYYPNPAQQHMRVLAEGSGAFDLVILNNLGQIVVNQPGLLPGQENQVDMKSLAPGIYVVQFREAGVLKKTGRVVKE